MTEGRRGRRADGENDYPSVVLVKQVNNKQSEGGCRGASRIEGWDASLYKYLGRHVHGSVE